MVLTKTVLCSPGADVGGSGGGAGAVAGSAGNGRMLYVPGLTPHSRGTFVDATRYKTRMCRNHMPPDMPCPFGERCAFAHGEAQLRPPAFEHRRYNAGNGGGATTSSSSGGGGGGAHGHHHHHHHHSAGGGRHSPSFDQQALFRSSVVPSPSFTGGNATPPFTTAASSPSYTPSAFYTAQSHVKQSSKHKQPASARNKMPDREQRWSRG